MSLPPWVEPTVEPLRQGERVCQGCNLAYNASVGYCTSCEFWGDPNFSRRAGWIPLGWTLPDGIESFEMADLDPLKARFYAINEQFVTIYLSAEQAAEAFAAMKRAMEEGANAVSESSP